MSLRLAYSTLRWKNPNLEPALEKLKEAGWQGWEGRLPLDWLGPPNRLRRICKNTDMPLVVFTARGAPDNQDWENSEHNKRRIDYAAEIEVDCFMFMTGQKPEDRPVNRDDIHYAAEGAEIWAEYAGQYGLELSYHIHTNTLVDSIEDWILYMSLLTKTKLCIDVSHAQLWGYNPIEAIFDFRDQLNYIHLQDYTSTSRDKNKNYLPVWCSVGEAENIDFPSFPKTLEEIEYSRWVTACPGPPIPGEDPVDEAKRSRRMFEYLKEAGY